MKEKKVIKKTISEDVIKGISCDCCGKKVTGSEVDILSSDITEFFIDFGYGSKYDTDRIEVDVCDKCIENIFSKFKRNPLKN